MGLLDGVLPAVYSAGNKLKRQVGGLLSDPVGTIQQQVGLLNDNASAFNQLHSKATQESVDSIKAGGSGMGPASQQLAGKIADAYNPMGMVVWHGSPHKFSKFDSSKIGTGEGAQAYGHGLYLAESEKVADEYAGKLSKKMVSIDGFGGSNIEKAILDRLSARANSTQYGSGAQAALDDLHSISRFGTAEEKAAANAMLNKIGPFGMPSVEDAGSLYKVDLPDDAIARMLDWDKPLSQQAPEVQRAMSEFGDLVGDADWQHAMKTDDKGSWFYRLMEDVHKNSPRGASVDNAKFLRDAGIPGIRYLDGGSRGAGGGTSNFVVFPGNEGLLKILERNGKPLE